MLSFSLLFFYRHNGIFFHLFLPTNSSPDFNCTMCMDLYQKKILLNLNVDFTNAATLLIGKVYEGLYLAYSRLCEEAR